MVGAVEVDNMERKTGFLKREKPGQGELTVTNIHTVSSSSISVHLVETYIRERIARPLGNGRVCECINPL